MFQRFLTALCIALLVLGSTTVAGAAKLHHSRFVHPTKLQMKEWTWVGWCETHDSWKMQGSLYTGALGITRSNWSKYGGGRLAPIAANAAPWEQIWVAMRIQGKYPVPDQPIGTCGKGW